MEDFLQQFFQTSSLWIIIVSIVISFFILSRSADILVDKTVVLSLKWGIPSMIVSATVVSLGTTLPEVSVSVSAAIDGDPGLALGNAVGSIITDSSLILGLALLICPAPVDKKLMQKQGAFQIGSALLLVATSFLFAKKNPFIHGGSLPQAFGFLLVALLVVYIIYSIVSGKNAKQEVPLKTSTTVAPGVFIFFQLAVAMTFVILSSKALIPALTELATRLNIPEGVIGATLVALGTSLPELTTAITSARKGHTEIALGNIIGADILNVLSVLGISLMVTPKGFSVGPEFYRIFFPSMLLILVIFQGSTYLAKGKPLGRKVSVILLAFYVATTVVSYILA